MKVDISYLLLTKKFDILKVLDELSLFWLNAVQLRMEDNNTF